MDGGFVQRCSTDNQWATDAFWAHVAEMIDKDEFDTKAKEWIATEAILITWLEYAWPAGRA